MVEFRVLKQIQVEPFDYFFLSPRKENLMIVCVILEV